MHLAFSMILLTFLSTPPQEWAIPEEYRGYGFVYLGTHAQEIPMFHLNLPSIEISNRTP